MSDDLRDEIAEALTREHYRRAAQRIEASPEDHQAAMVDAVVAVVAPRLHAALCHDIENDDTPNPGSDLAKQQGCLCPVLDNCHGRFAPYPGGNWVLRMDCPLHGPDPPAQEET